MRHLLITKNHPLVGWFLLKFWDVLVLLYGDFPFPTDQWYWTCHHIDVGHNNQDGKEPVASHVVNSRNYRLERIFVK